MLLAWLENYTITLLFEVPVAMLLAGRRRSRLTDDGDAPAPVSRAVGWRVYVGLQAIAINLVTHPVAMLVAELEIVDFGPSYFAIEAAVVIAEAAMYRFATGLSWRRAIAVSAVANALSAASAW